MPALVRLALDTSESEQGWYFPQLLFHLTYAGEENELLRHTTPEQREAIACFLHHIESSRQELLDIWLGEEELQEAIRLWSVHKG